MHLGLVGGQEDRWGLARNHQADVHFSMEKGMRIIDSVQFFFVRKRMPSAIKRVEFFGDRVSYITIRGRWCGIIALNVHVPTEDKIDDVKDRLV
jgi:hypothetical protein